MYARTRLELGLKRKLSGLSLESSQDSGRKSEKAPWLVGKGVAHECVEPTPHLRKKPNLFAVSGKKRMKFVRSFILISTTEAV